VGPGAARNHGVLAATFPLVFLMDSDIIVSPGSLTSLIDEFRLGNYEAIQSRLNSISAGSGYWGRALAAHHHLGKADNEWFGFSATLAQRDLLVRHPFDGELVSGEDMELARRFARAGIRVGVARKTTVVHRLGDKFENARKQWLDDGRGIASVMMLEGMRSAWMAAVPAAAAVRGIALSVLRAEPQWIPYYFGLAFFNMVGIGREVADVART